MATEKTLKTRIVLKHDIEASWNKATNFIPKRGEIIIYDPDSTYAVARQKVGDGTTKVSELPFVGPTIGGSETSQQKALSSISYTQEASVPASPVEGVEYACTDFIDEGDLDNSLQTKINSALTQTTADGRYFLKTEASTIIPTNIQNGEPAASIKQTSNSVQGEYDSAFGSMNTTSVKGYYIQGVYFSTNTNTTIFVLGTTYVNSIPKLTTPPTADTSFAAPEWDIGAEIAISATYNFRILGTITLKENNLLTVSPDLTSANITDKSANGLFWDNSICCPSAPTKGAVVLTAYSMATGYETVASGPASHSEGNGTTAYSAYSHAEGQNTFAGYMAHAEGNKTKALGTASHSEGRQTVASGFFSHAEGYKCISSGRYSHAQGIENEALGEGEFVLGKYSKPGENAVGDSVSNFLVRVGAGTSDTARANCFTIDADGTVSMDAAVIGTSRISRPFSVINKDYADNHYVQKGTYTSNVITTSEGTVLLLTAGEKVLINYVGFGFNASTGLYGAYSDSGQSIVRGASELMVGYDFAVQPWNTYLESGTTYWYVPFYYTVMEISEKSLDGQPVYFVRAQMHYSSKT